MKDQDEDLVKFRAIIHAMTPEVIEKVGTFGTMPSAQIRDLLKVQVSEHDKLLKKIKEIVDLVGRYLIEEDKKNITEAIVIDTIKGMLPAPVVGLEPTKKKAKDKQRWRQESESEEEDDQSPF